MPVNSRVYLHAISSLLLVALLSSCLLAFCASSAVGRPINGPGYDGDATAPVAIECTPAYAVHLHIGIGVIQGEVQRCTRLAGRETNESAESASCNGDSEIVVLMDLIVGRSAAWSIEIWIATRKSARHFTCCKSPTGRIT